jgi:hypothetical protein
MCPQYEDISIQGLVVVLLIKILLGISLIIVQKHISLHSLSVINKMATVHIPITLPHLFHTGIIISRTLSLIVDLMTRRKVSSEASNISNIIPRSSSQLANICTSMDPHPGATQLGRDFPFLIVQTLTMT